MKIIGLHAYQKGYTGCLEDQGKYVFFLFSRRTCKPVQEYSLNAFRNRRHFIGSMGKFLRNGFFLKEPLEITSVTQESLDRCRARLKNT